MDLIDTQMKVSDDLSAANAADIVAILSALSGISGIYSETPGGGAGAIKVTITSFTALDGKVLTTESGRFNDVSNNEFVTMVTTFTEVSGVSLTQRGGDGAGAIGGNVNAGNKRQLQVFHSGPSSTDIQYIVTGYV